MIELSVIIPAYNEEKAIEPTIEKTKKELQSLYSQNQYEILVIDDGSTDKTFQIAAKSGAEVLRHPYNIGNGAAVKKGIRRAGGKWILLMDGDGQHDPKYIPKFIELSKKYDMVIGKRSGFHNLSLHRKAANTFFNKFSSFLMGQKIIDLTSGYRLIRASIAKRFVFLLPNKFSYPTTLTMSLARSGYSIAYLPIQLNPRQSKSKISLFSDGIRFVTIMVRIAVFFKPLRIFTPISLACFLVGAGHGVVKVYILGGRYTGFTTFMLLFAMLVFLMGLISEQITQLRMERDEHY